MTLSNGFYVPLDVYLVNPQKATQADRDQYEWTTAHFDLCSWDFKLKLGQVTLEQWRYGIVICLSHYMSDHGITQKNIPSWMIDSPETFDRLFFGAMHDLCQREGLSFAGMIESVGFLLQ